MSLTFSSSCSLFDFLFPSSRTCSFALSSEFDNSALPQSLYTILSLSLSITSSLSIYLFRYLISRPHALPLSPISSAISRPFSSNFRPGLPQTFSLTINFLSSLSSRLLSHLPSLLSPYLLFSFTLAISHSSPIFRNLSLSLFSLFIVLISLSFSLSLPLS